MRRRKAGISREPLLAQAAAVPLPVPAVPAAILPLVKAAVALPAVPGLMAVVEEVAVEEAVEDDNRD